MCSGTENPGERASEGSSKCNFGEGLHCNHHGMQSFSFSITSVIPFKAHPSVSQTRQHKIKPSVVHIIMQLLDMKHIAMHGASCINCLCNNSQQIYKFYTCMLMNQFNQP